MTQNDAECCKVMQHASKQVKMNQNDSQFFENHRNAVAADQRQSKTIKDTLFFDLLPHHVTSYIPQSSLLFTVYAWHILANHLHVAEAKEHERTSKSKIFYDRIAPMCFRNSSVARVVN